MEENRQKNTAGTAGADNRRDIMEEYRQMNMVETVDVNDREERDKYREEELLQEEDDSYDSHAAVEAILFSMGDSVELGRIAAAIGENPSATEKILRELEEKYQSPESGIRLLELNGSWQLCTKKQYYENLIRIAKQPRKPVLTDVVLETLSIIAYRQPVTKAEIERIRGVSSDHAVNKLIEYGLIQEIGRLNVPGRPILFGTTERFLRFFGVSSAEGLPTLSAVQIEDFKAEAEAEMQVNVTV